MISCTHDKMIEQDKKGVSMFGFEAMCIYYTNICIYYILYIYMYISYCTYTHINVLYLYISYRHISHFFSKSRICQTKEISLDFVSEACLSLLYSDI